MVRLSKAARAMHASLDVSLDGPCLAQDPQAAYVRMVDALAGAEEHFGQLTPHQQNAVIEEMATALLKARVRLTEP